MSIPATQPMSDSDVESDVIEIDPIDDLLEDPRGEERMVWDLFSIHDKAKELCLEAREQGLDVLAEIASEISLKAEEFLEKRRSQGALWSTGGSSYSVPY